MSMNTLLVGLEQCRKKKLRRYRLAIFLTIFFLVVFLMVRMIIKLNTPEGSNWYQLSLLITMVSMVFFAYAYIQKQDYKAHVQDKLISLIVAQEFDDATYK